MMYFWLGIIIILGFLEVITVNLVSIWFIISGVIAKIGTICANKNVSLASILQHEVSGNSTAEITVITERSKEKLIKEVVAELDNCKVESLIRVAE